MNRSRPRGGGDSTNIDSKLPRTALVLGGASDIGQAMVAELAAHGLRKVMFAVRDPAVFATPLDNAETVAFVEPWDALDVDSHVRLIEKAYEAMGSVDLVICAVGMLGHHAGLGMAPNAVEAMVRTNFAGPAAALAAIASKMVDNRKKGSSDSQAAIVVISSVAAARPRRSNFVYGSSKSGLDSFARGLGDSLVGTGVRVLVIRPGFVRSKMTAGLDPAPFATEPEAVANAMLKALSRRGSSQVIWVPGLLGPLFAALGLAPTRLWRRIAGDR